MYEPPTQRTGIRAQYAPWPSYGTPYGEMGMPSTASRPLGRPARVLFLHPSDELYGSDQVLLNIVRGLDRRHFEPYVVVANDLNYEGLLSRELDRIGVPHHSTALAVARRKYFTPTGILEFRKRIKDSAAEVSQFVRDERVDLIYTNTLAVWTGAYVAEETGRPHFWHIHEQIERPRLLRDYMRRFVPKHADRIISVSRAGLEHLLTSSDAQQKGMVIYNGLVPQEWMNAPGREAVRAELGCGPQDVVFGMVARLSSFKAPDRFVEAAARLVGRYPHVHFFVAGGPVPGQTAMVEKVEALRLAAPNPERIHVLGYRRDTPALMSALDILVQPSRQPEACSMTILQAMFAGRAVVATEIGGNPELVVHDQTGLLTPVEDVDALTEAMEALALEGPRRVAYGRAGQQRALAYFTLDQQIAATNEVLFEEASRVRAEVS